MQITTFLFILFGGFLIVLPATAAVAGISDGGTNSGTALVNNKVMYSSADSIVEAPMLFSTGSNLKIGQSGVSTATASVSKLVLQGTDSSQANGPHIQTYVSSDQYPTLQIMSHSHGNSSICFDCYWDDTSLKSSSSLGNHQLYMASGSFSLRYGNGVSAGSTATLSTALSINTTTGVVTIPSSSLGSTTITSGLYLPTIYIDWGCFYQYGYEYCTPTPSNLDYYETYIETVTTSGAFSENAFILANRIGDTVTVTFIAVTGTVSSSASALTIGSIPNRFIPSHKTGWLVSIDDPTSCESLLYWSSNYNTFILNGCGGTGFTIGSGRGFSRDIVVRYNIF